MIANRGDRFFQGCIYVLTILIAIVTVYPLVYALSASMSKPLNIMNGNVWLWPVELSFQAYKNVFASKSIILGYGNTIYYAVVGTAINMVLSVMAAYPLSMPDIKGKNFVTILITFTMFFSGGIIPSYLNVRDLGLLNSRWAVMIPGAINATNMLILRNYFIHSVPGELREAASIDGCSAIGTMFKIVLPLSKSILMVVMLYYTVSHWNSYFDAMMYLQKAQEKWPLQVHLRNILIMSQMGDMAEQSGVDDVNTQLLYEALKYAIIVVSAAPLLILYPFVQRFFEKGIMMGSIKG
ncbi:MAG: carbohydrate ABC transporter permease [Clostridia bacterium]|nr:carbohydrate ABC transporter permease [Clostridia bacterium]MBR5984773.1 carbohydrate ABC transporter permease [Clostridia bacterium]MBR6007492.1 carbohydrate ABC transporter permease [Clostridia bacterium]